jgi:hypothetical protein
VRKAIENTTSGQTRLRGPLKNDRGFYAVPRPTIYDPSRPCHDGKPMTVRWLVAAYGSAIGIRKWGTPVRNVLEECAVDVGQTPYLRTTAS